MSVRPAAVAGLFYPDHASELSAYVSGLLAGAASAKPVQAALPKALIVPHAGLIYSGPIAACAYAELLETGIRRVVLIGPSHRIAFHGVALPDADTFETPLGLVRIDQQGVTLASGDAKINSPAHAMEHSLEVQLPFLQTVLNEFELLPLCVGTVEPEALASLLRKLWGGDETLILISSDLSHYRSYRDACEIDGATIDMILSMQGGINHEQACGATGINALLLLAAEMGLSPRLIDYRNSGDTAGDKARVVGYTAIGFYKEGAA